MNFKAGIKSVIRSDNNHIEQKAQQTSDDGPDKRSDKQREDGKKQGSVHWGHIIATTATRL